MAANVQQIGFVRILPDVAAADGDGDDLCTAGFDCRLCFGKILVFAGADQQARSIGFARND